LRGGSGSGERPDWGFICSDLITITGWTWEYIDEFMTLPRLYDLSRYWRDYPPIHALIGAFLGVKPSVKSEQKEKESIDQIIADFSAAGISLGRT
jgi:hypothetical protein